MKPKIVFLDVFTLNHGDLSWDSLREIGDLTIYERTHKTEVVERAKDADILIVNKVRLTEEIFALLPQLKLVCEAATGYDNIDIQAAARHGICVTHVPNYSTQSVAQTVISLLLNVTNPVAGYAQQNREGKWSSCPDFCYWTSPSIELSGKEAVVIGFGNIGESVAAVFHALGMHVLAVTQRKDLPEYVEECSLQDALQRATVVSLNCPLRADNYQFINAETLAYCRPDTIIINTARGALVDEEALAKALSDKQIYAYCADVLSQEPPKANHPLLSLSNAYITPHIAWTTAEARQRIINILVDNIHQYLNGQPKNVVM